MRAWVDSALQEQHQAGLAADPVFSQDTVVQKLDKVSKLYKKVSNKKKPKAPKKETKDDPKDED